MDDIDSSTRGLCAILSGNLVAQEGSLSFICGRPGESWSSLGEANEFVLESLNFAGDIVQDGNCRKRAILKNRLDSLFINLDYGGWARSPFLLTSNFNRW